MFFGPNAAVYLRAYDRMRDGLVARPGGRWRGLFLSGMSGPAFFVGPVWFFYRKLWVYGAVLTGVLVGLDFLPIGRLSLPISLGIAVMAKPVYLQHAMATIERLRGPDGRIDPGRLLAAGGVSRLAGWIGGSVYALLCLAGIAALIYLVRTGQGVSGR